MPTDYKPLAQAVIAQYYKFSGLDEESLGIDLARQVFSSMLLVSTAFDLLKGSEQMWTGYYMIKSMPDGELQMLGLYKEGRALLSAIYSHLDADQPYWDEDKKNFGIAARRAFAAISQDVKLTNYDPRTY